MIAVIKTGGKQYKIKEGDVVKVEKIEGDVDQEIDLGAALLLFADDESTLDMGTPVVDGSNVKAKIVEQGRSRKVTIVKYKPKVRYRRKQGHRQHYTKVQITKISK
jgi:large subunit ribosomal protein L21